MLPRRQHHAAIASIIVVSGNAWFACSHQTNPDAVNRDTVITMDATSDAASDPGVAYVFVGSDDGKIRVAAFDRSTGAVGAFGAYAAGTNPAFVALAPDGQHLFAVDESANRVLAFTVDRSTGALTSLGGRDSTSTGPTHLSVDATGRWLLVAHYTGGRYAIFPIASDGQLGAATDSADIGGNAHYIAAEPSNRFVYVPCLGANYVAQRSFDVATGKLQLLPPPAPASVPSVAGAGPRHLALRRDGKFGFVVNERNSSVTSYAINSPTGALTAGASLSTLPTGFAGNNTGAGIAITPDGNFLFTSNRGHNSIAGFAIAAATGGLTAVGHTSTDGATPRAIAIDTSGRWLIAGNQGSNTLRIFAVASDGGLSPVATPLSVPAKPTFVAIFSIK